MKGVAIDRTSASFTTRFILTSSLFLSDLFGTYIIVNNPLMKLGLRRTKDSAV